METETIDKLFLELSQVTRATTAKELALYQDSKRLRLIVEWWYGNHPELNLRKALGADELLQMVDKYLAAQMKGE